ncbi:hypothetical protein [Kitasatospora sp. NPDC094011]|uniref:hypothetical protein n=1 Tax=Kitasatospora sp. NPDC094011 TaxID=3364090 RepID=UPI003803494B
MSAPAAAAEVAGELHRAGGDVTLGVGCELTVFMAGLVPGADVAARLASLAAVAHAYAATRTDRPPPPTRLVAADH